MPTLCRRAAAGLLALMLAACSALPPHRANVLPATHATAPVLLVSIDGFRADYLDLGITPNLARIAREGVRAQWMNPSYPTLTFPNHYTIVTGLRPDKHGIVHNTMHDDALGSFKSSDGTGVATSQWWGGEPIWVGAANAGLPTATMFWPGSEATIGGRQPDRWHAFDEAVSLMTRVDTVLGWLGESAPTRPRVSTLYFDLLDGTSHDYGPDSREAHAAIREVDAAIGRLLEGLDARGLLDEVNLLIVSDHGMAEVGPGHVVVIESMVDPADAVAVTDGQSIGFAPLPGRTVAAERRLLGAHAH
ncbi:MAG: ectonucleotide pyrophosphatase/phosphodiesterase, partial [Lysobacter sp.]